MNTRHLVLTDSGICDFMRIDDSTIEIDYWFPGLELVDTQVGIIFSLAGKLYRVIADLFEYRRVRAILIDG